MRCNEDGFRLCDQEGCELLATEWLVWTKPQCYCIIHAQKMLNVADAMGHLTPAATYRKMTPDEMYPESEESS